MLAEVFRLSCSLMPPCPCRGLSLCQKPHPIPLFPGKCSFFKSLIKCFLTCATFQTSPGAILGSLCSLGPMMIIIFFYYNWAVCMPVSAPSNLEGTDYVLSFVSVRPGVHSFVPSCFPLVFSTSNELDKVLGIPWPMLLLPTEELPSTGDKTKFTGD